jgi:NAD-dependent deacetylase
VWEWYTWQHHLIACSNANAGHYAFLSLVEDQKVQFSSFVFITQNVAGLHQKARSPADIELFGKISQIADITMRSKRAGG